MPLRNTEKIFFALATFAFFFAIYAQYASAGTLNEGGYNISSVQENQGGGNLTESGFSIAPVISSQQAGTNLTESSYSIRINIYTQGIGGLFTESSYTINLIPSVAFQSNDCEITPYDDACSLSISVDSPSNTTFSTTDVWANVTTNKDAAWCGRSLNGGANVTLSNTSTTKWYNQMTGLSEGVHNVKFYCNSSTEEASSSTIFFTVDSSVPTITVQQPTNSTLGSTVWVNVTISEVAHTVFRSLDGGANVSLTNSSGNWNNKMTSLSRGPHKVTVYANDTAGSQASPVTVFFTVEFFEPFCLTVNELSDYYLCSYDNTEFANSKAAALIHSGDVGVFDRLCGDTVADGYKFNLTTRGTLRSILPFTNAVCTDIGNKSDIIEKQGIPSSIFGDVTMKGDAHYSLSLFYDRITIRGEARIGPGTHRLCIEKIGTDNFRAIVNIKVC